MQRKSIKIESYDVGSQITMTEIEHISKIEIENQRANLNKPKVF